jgi:hypothetical protein
MLYIPRRHRRKLLLPPGLLALAFLLLVGCGILKAQARIRSYAVLQLTTPNLCGQLNSVLKTVCISPANELEQENRFCTISFTGNSVNDDSNMRFLQHQLYIRHTTADSVAFEKGLAIRFHDKSRYASFISVLDTLAQTKRKWFFHTYAPVSTIYVLSK